MSLTDFDYKLPKHLIAQRPVEPRDSSKLMVLRNEKIQHKTFRDLVGYLEKGDVLALNDSKVLPVRLYGRKETGGKVELLLIKRGEGAKWESLIKGKNIRENTKVILGEDRLEGIVKRRIEGGRFEIEFLSEENIEDIIQEIGKMPIPPYIKEPLVKPERYQTIYANKNGSIAAPTAGLHFTESMLNELKTKGIEIVNITLHVGLGTFLPVKNHDIKKHKFEPEYFQAYAETARKINYAKKHGNKIFAVGTTTVRALESACNDSREIVETNGESNLFIYPGYEFKTNLDGLLTNFHLPKSTLLMLVSAYAGRDTIMKAYKVAIENSYRFYSFGDAMLIMKG
jgi:S-adenosylmethionine:tRNA ribosyltransferase-isomerase